MVARATIVITMDDDTVFFYEGPILTYGVSNPLPARHTIDNKPVYIENRQEGQIISIELEPKHHPQHFKRTVE